MKTLGSRLKELREKMNKTQLDVSSDLGISNVVLSRYESGDRKPDPETLSKFVEYYRTNADYLLGLKDDPSPSVQLDIPSNINIAYLDGVKHELTPEVARRLKEDIKLFEELKKQWKRDQEEK